MNAQWRDFLFLVALAAAATTPALGQNTAPAIGRSSSDTQRAASVPDLSGIWGHTSIPGFEPPASGPGPVLNKSRIRTGPQTGRSANNQFVGDYTNPILKPQAADVVKNSGEIELSGIPAPRTSSQCWPQPVPFILSNAGMQMIQQPQQITILYNGVDNQVRQVRMNDSHPPRVTPSWYGDSVGYYEGDTLVIDTVGVKVDRPFAMVDWFGTPYSEALHVVERYRLLDYEVAKEALERDAKENFQFPWEAARNAIAKPFISAPLPGFDAKSIRTDPSSGKYLQLQFTVEDEGVFTMPWSATITYRPTSGEWVEYICAENPHEYYGGKDTPVPRAEKPDF
jgi:hypothetical protein